MNELPQGASVWLRVTVIDTDVWTSAEGAPMTTFETPCGETFCVFSEGLEIVPASPVGADRDALGRIVRETWVAYCIETGDTKPSHIAPWEALGEWDKEADRRIGEAIRDAIQATPEPERAE